MEGLRRVVITGLGVCSPLGVGAKHAWEKLISGRSGIVSIDCLPNAKEFDKIPSRVVGLVPRGEGEGFFSESDWIAKWEKRTMNTASVYAICSAAESLLDAGLVASSNPPSDGPGNKLPKYSLRGAIRLQHHTMM